MNKDIQNSIVQANNQLLDELDKEVPLLTENNLRQSVISFVVARLAKLQALEEQDNEVQLAIKKEKLERIREHRLDISELIQVEAQENEREQNKIRLKIAETESILQLFKATNNMASPIIQPPKNDGNDDINKVLSGLQPRQMQILEQFIKKMDSIEE
jgi:hypothetical protein